MPNLLRDARGARDVAVPCERLLDRVDGAHLDCVSDALALALASYGVADVRAPFAVDWRFDVVERPGEPPVLDLPPADQDDLLARRTGLRPRWTALPERPPAAEEAAGIAADWYAALAAGDPVVVVADAYHLPWVPYAGHEHMTHGFVVDGWTEDGTGAGVVHVADPYDNPTEHGRATPTACEVGFDALLPALAGGRWAVLRPVPRELDGALDAAGQVEANAAAILAAERFGAYARFVAHHEPNGLDELGNLTLQTWLLARNRGLHARWLADLPAGAVDQGAVTSFAAVHEAWRKAAEAAYIALRRVRTGRQAPTIALAALTAATTAEVELAGALVGEGSREDGSR